MNKKAKTIYILGSALIGALAVLCVYFVLLATGVVTVQKSKVVVSSVGATKEYDGNPLTNASWKLVSGELKKGHVLEATMTGEQTDVGTSSNFFTIIIKDEKGKDVTDDYSVEYQPGDLVVSKRKIEVRIKDEEKVYDGTPAIAQDYTITKGSLLSDHHLDITYSGELTNAGEVESNATCLVKDSLGNDVTSFYEITVIKGTVTINPIKIVIQTESDFKTYDGDPLENDGFDVVSVNQILDGHEITVSVVGSITMQGTVKNEVAQVVITDAYGEDVTDNYEIEYILGELVVQGTLPAIGGGGGGLDISGLIGLGSGGGGGGGENSPAFSVYSEKTDMVYFRYFSFTDYTGRNWTNSTEGYSELIDDTYCANYLSGIALESLGVDTYNMEIEMLSYNYLLPYYLPMGEYNYDVQTNDVLYSGNYSERYSLAYYPFNYVNQSNILVNANLGNYSSYEEAYRAYVYDKYLGVPNTSATYLQGVIDENAFNKNDVNIIKKVAEYIQNAAVYSKEYDREMDEAEDILVAFLSEYKEGICQHYALAATMMYRQLGIPARYTIGYMAQTYAGQWVTVTGQNAHGWVEVYIDGIGWVNVEVTGGESERIPNLGEFTIQVKSKYVNVSDQDVIHASELEYELQGFEEFASQGYDCEVVLSGRQIGVGKSLAVLESVTVIDPDGYDVTPQFKINFRSAYMSVYEKKITILTDSAEHVYDGTPLTCSGYSILNGELMAGHSVVITPIGSLTVVGEVRNTAIVNIVDTYGNNVSDMYYIIVVTGTLTVKPQPITIRAGSATKPHDGVELTCDEYTLYDANGEQIYSLGEHVNLEVVIEGSIIECGRCDNIITYVKVTDAEGNDITSYYQIAKENGTLRVTLPNN